MKSMTLIKEVSLSAWPFDLLCHVRTQHSSLLPYCLSPWEDAATRSPLRKQRGNLHWTLNLLVPPSWIAQTQNWEKQISFVYELSSLRCFVVAAGIDENISAVRVGTEISSEEQKMEIRD